MGDLPPSKSARAESFLFFPSERFVTENFLFPRPFFIFVPHSPFLANEFGGRFSQKTGVEDPRLLRPYQPHGASGFSFFPCLVVFFVKD